MTQTMLRAASQATLLKDCQRMILLGWSLVGSTYKEGLYWYQAVTR
jgi:hypothetical protein